MENKYSCDCDIIHEDIVDKVNSQMRSGKEYLDLSSLYKMFADPTRLKVLHALSNSEMCVCDLAALLGMTKSAISHQLKSLRMSNLVQYRKEGQIVYYSLADDHVKLIMDMGMEHIHE